MDEVRLEAHLLQARAVNLERQLGSARERLREVLDQMRRLARSLEVDRGGDTRQ